MSGKRNNLFIYEKNPPLSSVRVNVTGAIKYGGLYLRRKLSPSEKANSLSRDNWLRIFGRTSSATNFLAFVIGAKRLPVG